MNNNQLRTEQFYIDKEVVCLNCGKYYIPSKVFGLIELGIPPILANNYCSGNCYDESMNKIKK